MVLAVALRIILNLLAVHLLAIPGIMLVAATLIARLLESYPLIGYIGTALFVCIGVEMFYEDMHRFFSGETNHGEYREFSAPLIRIG